MLHFALVPQTTTIWDDVRIASLMEYAILSVSGSKGAVVLSIVGKDRVGAPRKWLLFYLGRCCFGLFIPDWEPDRSMAPLC